MTERYIFVTDDEYVFFLDTKSEDYKTLEDFEKMEFANAKKDNIDIEEYEGVILQSASNKYWEYVYEYYIDANVVCDLVNKFAEENEQLRKELFESKKDYLIETYADNPIRRDDRIKSLKEEFKKRFGDVEAKILREDLSEYVPEKSHNGGCYGFASAEVVKVIERGGKNIKTIVNDDGDC